MIVRKVMTSDVTALLLGLQELLSLNFTAAQALDHLIRFPVSAPLLPVLLDIRSRLHQGADLSSAFAPHVKLVGQNSIALLACAELTGATESVLSDIVRHRQWTHSVKRDLVQKLVQPVVSAVMLLAAAGFQLIYVVPRATEFLGEQGDVDLSTRWLLVVTFGLIDLSVPLLSLLAVCVLTLLLLRWFVPTMYGRSKQALFRVLMLERSLFNLDMARYLRSLSLLNSNGLGLSASMKAAESSVSSEHLSHQLSNVRSGVASGQMLSRSLSSYTVLSQRYIAMLGVAEQSAALTSRLRVVSEILHRDAQDAIHRYCLRLVPLTLSLSGLILLWIVLGIFVPMYESAIVVGYNR